MPAYTWALQSGTLPTGMTLSAGGVLSGTTNQIGGFNFVALVTDVNGLYQATRSYLLSISCPTITINPALRRMLRLVRLTRQLSRRRAAWAPLPGDWPRALCPRG